MSPWLGTGWSSVYEISMSAFVTCTYICARIGNPAVHCIKAKDYVETVMEYMPDMFNILMQQVVPLFFFQGSEIASEASKLDLHSVESAKIAVDILRHLLRRSNNFTSNIQV